MGTYVLAVLLILGWALGVAYFNAGAGIYLLLFIAMLSVAGNQKKHRRIRTAIRKKALKTGI